MRPTRRRWRVTAAVVVACACATDRTVGPATITALFVTPDSLEVGVGQIGKLNVIAVDTNGVAYVGAPSVWASQNTAAATVSTGGVVTGVAVGTAIITATAGGFTASATVTVAPPPVIALSRTTVGFAGVAGGPSPGPDSVTITNAGGVTLGGLAIDTIAYAGASANWLTAALDGGAAPTMLRLVPASTGLALGTHVATVTLSAPGATNSPQDITVNLVLGAGAPTEITLSAGDGQTAPVSTAAPVAPAVLVRDQYGNPVAGVAVTFAVGSGGGSVTGGAATSDASGIAHVGSWTLGTAVGPNTLTATAPGLAGSPLTFAATAAPGAPAQVASNGGDGQTVTVGQTVPTSPSVRVRDQFNNPVPGVSVTFAVQSGAGTVTAGAATTDAGGVAQVGSWTLGTSAGPNTLTATVPGVPGSPVTFTATAVAGAASQVAASAGTNQTAPAGTAVPVAPAVTARDQFGNPVAGVVVTFAVGSGGGSLTGGVAASDANGIARVGSWTLGTTAGPNTLTATVPGLAGSPVPFTATAAAGAATQVAISAGNGQTATVNAAVAVAPAVVVRDQFNNPVPSVAVTFAVTGGGGTIAGASQTTNASGVATATSWTLGTTAGANTLSATVTGSGIAGNPVTFTATGTAGAATQIAVQAGNGQSATVNTAVATAPAVIVRDQFANPVAGVSVTFTVTGGGGAITPASPASVSTGAGGIAALTNWTLGTVAGANALQATAAGLAGSPVSFTATGTAGAATQIAVNAGNGQSGTVNTTVATAPSVLVRDQFNNPVAGVSVTFTVTGGGGSTTPASPASISTNASGIAALTSWRLGTAAGANTMTATSAGLTGSPVAFTATGTAGIATQIGKAAGDAQSATAGATLAVDPAVLVGDAFNNPVAGVTVTFAVASGGGSITGATAVSLANGLATLGSWTLGAAPGANSLTATAPGLTGSPLTFTATGNSGSARNIALSAGNAQSDTVAATLPVAYAVLITDSAGNPVAGVAVGWAVTGGGGSIAPPSSNTNASGIATATRTLGTTAGTQTATASVGGLIGSPVPFTATATAGAARQIAVSAGNNQSATVNTTVGTAPAVIVRDQFGNPKAGIGVTFAVTAGGGSVSGGSQTTNASGIATVTSWTLGTAAGTSNNTLQATSAGLTGSPVAFTASATAGAATQMALNAGNGQSATVNTTVAIAPSVIVRDQFSNPVAGVSVTFTLTGGGGSISPASPAIVITGPGGIAQVTSWTMGTSPGANTLQATSGGLAGSPVAFSATATAGGATQIAVNAGSGQSATVNTAVTTAPSVIVRDQFNNPVAGVSVTFTVTGGGGAISPASPATVQTNASGIAQVTSWTLGTVAGANSLQATSTGLTGSPVTFTATGTAGAATQIALNGGNGQSATVNTAVATDPSVLVRDAFNNPVLGAAVTFAVTGGGGSVTGGSQTTNASGIATVTSWTLGTAAGTNTLQATSTGLTGSPVSFTATGTPGAPSATNSTIATTSPIIACQTACTTGGGTQSIVTVTVRDGFNNPIQGAGVTWTASGTGNALTNASGTTDALGVFNAGRLSSTVAQAKTIAATINSSVAISPNGSIVVNPDVVSLAASIVTATSPITASSGSSVSTATVTVTDQFGNGISGRTVTIAVSPVTGNTVTQPASLTNASGVTTGSFFTTQAATKTVTAAVTGVGTITDNALVTVSPAAASVLVVTTEPAGATSNVIFTTQPVVQARDPFGNGVSGVSVTATVSSGTGTLSGTTILSTNASGNAAYTNLSVTGQLTGVGSHRIRFGATGLTPDTSATFLVATSFSYNVRPIFVNNGCDGCHGVLTWALLVNQPSSCAPLDQVEPFTAGQSYLQQKVDYTPACGGNGMPIVGIMPQATRDVIRAWINEGAANN